MNNHGGVRVLTNYIGRLMVTLQVGEEVATMTGGLVVG